MTPQQFKNHRKDLGLNQKQLAYELRLSPNNGMNYIRMIEKGKKEPSGVLIRCFELIIEKGQTQKELEGICRELGRVAENNAGLDWNFVGNIIPEELRKLIKKK